MFRIKIHLKEDWILDHIDDEELPIDHLKEFIEYELKEDLQVESTGPSELVCKVIGKDQNVDFLGEEMKEEFFRHYCLGEESEVWDMNIEQDSEGEDNGNTRDFKAELPAGLSERLARLVGGESFKALVQEIVDIAPQIMKNNTFDSFTGQSYLFSLNDGDGLSEYLQLLTDVIGGLKLKNMSGCKPLEEKLPPPQGEDKTPFNEVNEMLERGNKAVSQLFCIDISEWMNRVDSKLFKEFLMEVEAHTDEFIFVFRVPFVEKEVLAKVKNALNDLMFVRTVSFAPFTREELQQLAENELKEHGFSLEEEAWEGFHERIAEEKRDGRFYGVKTVKKVTKELLYKKQLKNAREGTEGRCISSEDTLDICEKKKRDEDGFAMLDKLVGGEAFKQRILEILAQIELSKKDPNLSQPCLHMRFVGNPGTGKTTVARIIGKILKEKGVLRTGNFFEYGGRDLVGRYIGETAPKTSGICRDAYGSVLFLDEAYSLYRGNSDDRDFGREALDTLIAEMENHRGDLIVIMAGYTDDMEILMKGNAGLASRMPYTVEFPNFTREQLYQIFVSMSKGRFEIEEDVLPAVKEFFDAIPEKVLKAKEFSNARYVRNLFERTWAKASMRCQLNKLSRVVLTREDFVLASSDKEFTFLMEKKVRIGFGE